MSRISASPRTSCLHAAARVLAILTLLALAFPAVPAHAAVDRNAAVSLVTETQLGGSLDGVRLWVHPDLQPAGRTISAWHAPILVTPAPGWFVFVDRLPGANWEHPAWYLFVDAATGEVRRFEATTPPLNLPELTEITHGRDNPPAGVSEEALQRYSERLKSLPKPEGSRGQAWALLISGGANQSNNHIRYWNDMAFIYRTLVQYYGYADNHIRVCMSDGTSPAVDRSDGTNSPTDLDGDGDADTEYPATLQYVGQVFGELAATLTPSDQLFIFTTDHGGQESGYNCYLNLWNMEELRDDQMASYVAALPCQTIICTFEQCFSGGMIDDLQGDGRVIATAANYNEYSWAMPPDYTYDTFVYHWTSAVAWQNPNGTPVNADTNGDGIISMREAFLYAEAHDYDDETPQYSSTPAGLGEMTNLFGNMEGVYLAVSGMTIDDDNVGASHGNGNHVIDFGETIELGVALNNMGNSDAFNVVGTLATTSPYVTLITPMRGYGTIPSGGTVTNPQPFVFSVANNVPNGEPLAITLNVTEDPGTLPLDLSANAPAYAVSVTEIDDTTGDMDGTADPGETVGLTLKIENQGGCATPSLSAVLEGSGYFTIDPSTHPVGVIPVGGSVSVTGFTVQIAPDCPAIYTGQLTLHLDGPDSYAVDAGVFLFVGPWFDTAETDQGWTLGLTSDTATTGQWVRADPVGTTYNGSQCQTENDHTADPGHICFVTGNGTVGGAAGDSDVDGGHTTLLSPIFNVQGATSATLDYWRWYTNNLGNGPNQDYWDVDVTADGANWIHLEHTTSSANSWTEQTFDLGSVVPLNNTLRFRFIADDTSPGSLVEAAVDDIMFSVVRPPSVDVAPPQTALSTGLTSCRPNPISSGAVVTFRLGERSPVRLDLYDVSGRRVRALMNGSAEPGVHTVSFRAVDDLGRDVPSGIYFVRMNAGSMTQVKQVTIVR